MGRRTCALHKGKVYTWKELLNKFKIEHVDGVSAHTEWDAACLHRKLPKIEVIYWDEINTEIDDERKTFIVKNTSSPIPKAIRDAVWMRDVGNFKNGKCYVCKRFITDDLYETGHIKSRDNNGSDDFDNLRVVCVQCNKAMGTRDLEDYKETYHSKTIHRLNILNDMTKEDVIKFFEDNKLDVNYGKFYEKAIKLLENCQE